MLRQESICQTDKTQKAQKEHKNI